LDIADDSEDEDSEDDENEDCEDDNSLPKASDHLDSADDSEDEESEDSADDSEDEDSEGKMGAPECIHEFLRSVDAKVEELLRSNYRFHVNFLIKEIARAKRRQDQDLQGRCCQKKNPGKKPLQQEVVPASSPRGG
jgi:hypothetical protein